MARHKRKRRDTPQTEDGHRPAKRYWEERGERDQQERDYPRHPGGHRYLSDEAIDDENY